jgi:hypothetical protein
MPYQNQARRVIWEGMDKSGKKFIDAFPPSIVERKSQNDMALYLKNGSMFQVLGGDDPDKLVGANPVGLVFSEYALTDPRCWQLVAPILAENDGWAIFNSTPRGKNHFYKLLNLAKSRQRSWHYDFQTAKTLKVLSPKDLRDLRDELADEALFQQEAFCSFETPLTGAYYATQMKFLESHERLGKIPIDPALPVYTAWDLGMDDATAIWMIQRHRREFRAVGYYENSGEGLPHYVAFLKEWAAQNDVTFEKHFAPHDIKVRDWGGDGKSRLDIARAMGLRFTPVKKVQSIADRIEATRKILPMFWMDEEQCGRGIEALKSYRKEWDASKQAFNNRPLHDWACHGADALGTFAMGITHNPQDIGSLPTKYT